MHLHVSQLRKRFGALEAVKDATFSVRSGEVVGLLGPNGAGKSTILACLAGLLAPDGGAVRLDARPLPPEKRRDALFYLPDGVHPWDDQSADWVLDFGVALTGGEGWQGELAESLGLDALRGRRMGALSKGQRRRVLLALALATPHPIVLMDEPFDGLDLRQTRDAIALLRRLAARGRGLVLSIHAMRDAERVCDRLVLVADGTTVAEGTPAELRSRAGLSADAELEEVFLALA